MTRALLIVLLPVLALCGSCSSTPQAQTKAQRQPLQKEPREYKTPANYEPRDRGYDPKTGKVITYDHKPRVELIDEKAGKYAFKWLGYDGKDKSVIFQRGDMIDVIVNANASTNGSGEYLYTYEVQNLSSSGSNISTFTVQNYSEDVRPERKGPMLVLTMSKAIYKFREGHWISFNDASDDLQINPGQSVKLQLMSSAPPGVIGCAVVGGQLTIEGAGEDMPSVLENLLPGYEEWRPHG